MTSWQSNSITQIVVECKRLEEERSLLEEETKKIDECGMEKFRTLDNTRSEKTIAILGDRWWPQKARQEGDKINAFFCLITSDSEFSNLPAARVEGALQKSLLHTFVVLILLLRINRLS